MRRSEGSPRSPRVPSPAGRRSAINRSAVRHRRLPTDLLRAAAIRLSFLPVAAFLAATGAFWLVNGIPSNPGALIAGQAATPQQIHQINVRLGLTRSLLDRYGSFLWAAVHGNLGHSYYTGTPVTSEIAGHIVSTLELVACGVAIAAFLGKFLGFAGAYFQNRLTRSVSRVVTSFVQSSPDFLIGLFLILVFFSWMHIAAPPSGQAGLATAPPPTVTGATLIDAVLAGEWSTALDALNHLLLPAFTLGLAYSGFFANVTRHITARTMASGSTEFSRAQGLPSWRIARRVLRQSRTERLTYVGLLCASLIGGDALVETVFSWGGYGSFIVQKILILDLPEIEGFVVISAIITVLIFYSVDLITLAWDPRMKKAANATPFGQPRPRRAGRHRASDEKWDSVALIPVPLAPDRPAGRASLLARSLAESATATQRLARRSLTSNWRTELAAYWTVARRWAGVILPGLFILGLVLAAFFAPLRYNPDAVSPYATFQPPSLAHWFGTDSIGRDVFSRTIVSARTDLPLALAGATLSLVVGVPLGLLASLGGRLSVLIMRGLDVFQALPLVVLAITLVVLAGNHLVNVIPAIMVIGVPQFIRITRASAQSVAGRRFVDAAKASGASNMAILWHEILPNIRGTVLGQYVLTCAQSILMIAALSYLGVGIQPPTASWGAMLQAGSESLLTGQWWTVAFPGIALVAVVWCLNTIGHSIEATGGKG